MPFKSSAALLLTLLILSCSNSNVWGHDLWIETNVQRIGLGEWVRVDFKLGNCSHGRADLKTNGVLGKQDCSPEAFLPTGKSVDLTHRLRNSAFDPDHGYWTCEYDVSELGTTWFVQSLDQKILHDGEEVHGIMSAKSFVQGVDERHSASDRAADLPLDLTCELILESPPCPSLDDNQPVRVRLVLDDKPLPEVVVNFLSFRQLSDGKDGMPVEVITDKSGVAEFKPRNSGLHLIFARHLVVADDVTDEMTTYYSTSLSLHVSRHSIANKNSTLE